MTGFNKYPNLFKPIQLGDTIFRNRIFSAPTGLLDLTPECAPTQALIDYFVRKAKGGAAAVNIGECMVDSVSFGRYSYDSIQMKDHKHNYNGLGKLAENIQRYGAIAAVELQKIGIASTRDGETLSGPSEGPNPFNEKAYSHGMTEEEILQTIDDYSEAALYAKNRGFGMVTIHGGHGWLVQQFFSPWTNKRTDRWGGSVENRARFAVAIIDDIHRKCGKNFPVEIRISGDEHFDGGYDISGGIDFARQLDGHADLIHVSAGNAHAPGDSLAFTHPSIFKEGGCNVELAEEIKKYVKTPIATVGGLSDPDQLEEIIATGKADIVVMARGLICDPDLPIKARTGRDREIRRCLRCFNCVHQLYEHGRLFCAINPESGKDREISDVPPLKESKHILIAGGGMAGMEAAITAANEGHKVTLCEKSDELGGVLRCEVKVPFKTRVGEYIEHQKYMIAKSGIEVRLNTEVTPELAKQLQPDVIIAAMGSRPSLPPIAGINGKNVLTAEQAFAHPECVGSSAVILGAGLTGIELGVYLRGLGKDVTVVEKEATTATRWNGGHIKKLADSGATTLYSHDVVEITDAGVRCSTKDGKVFIEGQTVIIALGMKPLWDEALALSDSAGEYYQVGDCRRPRDILSATGEAWTAAKMAGKF